MRFRTEGFRELCVLDASAPCRHRERHARRQHQACCATPRNVDDKFVVEIAIGRAKDGIDHKSAGCPGRVERFMISAERYAAVDVSFAAHIRPDLWLLSSRSFARSLGLAPVRQSDSDEDGNARAGGHFSIAHRNGGLATSARGRRAKAR